MAIGLTVLGAVGLILLRRVVYLSIPVIGDYIAEILQIVQKNLDAGSVLRGFTR